MKVAIFTNNFFPRISGVAVAVKFQESALRSLGYETLVVAPDYGFDEKVQGVRVVRVKSLAYPPKKLAFPLQFLDRTAIEDAIVEFNPDLIHTHHPFLLGKSALELADQLQVPLVYTFHTLYDFFVQYFLVDTEPVRRQIRDYVVNFANCCDLVIAPTEPIRKYLVRNQVQAKTATIPTGIDFSRFDNLGQHRLEKRKKRLKLDKFDYLLLYAGRIAREKNLSLVFKALRVLVNQKKDIGLVIAGDGPAKRAFQKEIDQLLLQNRVIWAGFLSQEELPEIYYLADCFVFPSLADTQGIVLYEAQAAGLPIVALKSMASEAIIKDGGNGRFAENNARDFARKIKEVLEHKERFQVRFDKEQFSQNSTAKRYQELYQQLLKAGRTTKAKQLGTIFFPFFNPP